MKKILIIGFVWPEPTTTAAGTRILQLISIFKEYGLDIYFVSSASKTTQSYNLSEAGIKASKIELNCSSFDDLIIQYQPDIVLFDRYLTEEQFGWRVSENCPNALKILDTEDLHFLRFAREKQFKSKVETNKILLNNDITKREIASIYRCDISLIISKYELELLITKFKIDLNILCYTPFLLNEITQNTFKNYPSFNERVDFMTIGNFKHKPNLEAVRTLKKHIWPKIKKQLPKATIHIYGAYGDNQSVLQLHNAKEGFLIEGWAKNKEISFSNARICLAPLLFGAGLKGKLIDAMIYGTPSITTSIGSEGINNGGLPYAGFIENDFNNFIEKAIKLYQNEEIWLKKQQNGIQIINSNFSKNKFGKELMLKIETIFKDLENHRNQNFIGSMLLHHTLKSTKYMSKWIEEKNKK
ncbi:glycosyltransferase [Lutibacter sp. A80]|uniref:glycosyltransferase n=1 Tax=Lutibacter sp. A80 TaxID=2918453 RepID=UPI001F069956|nr:glycosyltransferase [Lutibacter sp. A80]UMB61136.1 glycosyltransferase [Lutibacter sp. A80]